MKKIFVLLPVTLLIFSCSNNRCEKENKALPGNISQNGTIEVVNSLENDVSPFGIQFNPMPFHQTALYDSLDTATLIKDLPALVQSASGLGLKWVRLSVDWPAVEDNNGVYHWEILDKAVKLLNEKKIEIYLCLHSGHPVHTQKRPPITDRELAAWKTWVDTIVGRYQKQIDYWEIWNEGNSIWFWNNAPDADQYMKLVKVTADVIKKKDPGAKIIGGSLARLDLPFARQLFEKGIAEHIDVFTFHPYGVFPEAIMKKIQFQVQTPHWYIPVDHQVDSLINVARRYDKNIEIWQGECGYPSGMNSMGWNGTGPWTENVQSKWLLRRMFTDLSFNANVSCYFVMKECPGSGDKRNYKGLVRLENTNDKKPAWYVFQNLIGSLRGSFTSIREHKAEYEVANNGSFIGAKGENVFSVLLEDQDKKRYFAYWLLVRFQDKITPGVVNLKIEDPGFKRPVLKDMMTGNVYDINDWYIKDGMLHINRLPLADYPFLITENNLEQ